MCKNGNNSPNFLPIFYQNLLALLIFDFCKNSDYKFHNFGTFTKNQEEFVSDHEILNSGSTSEKKNHWIC